MSRNYCISYKLINLGCRGWRIGESLVYLGETRESEDGHRPGTLVATIGAQIITNTIDGFLIVILV